MFYLVEVVFCGVLSKGEFCPRNGYCRNGVWEVFELSSLRGLGCEVLDLKFLNSTMYS